MYEMSDRRRFSVSLLTVRHEISDITPQEFDIGVKQNSFQAKVTVNDHEGPSTLSMKGRQFPIISNSATTGHKLQGCTLEELAVFEQFYGQNWMYVVLSRVRTMAGLYYLASPLSEDLSKYAMSTKMKNMIERFQSRIGLQL
jgi:hypothetical protein